MKQRRRTASIQEILNLRSYGFPLRWRPLLGMALASLLISSQPASAIVVQSFTDLGTFTTSQLVVGDVTVTGNSGVSAADVNVLNLNGLGVVGGLFNDTVDSSEALLFDFSPHAVPWVSYTVLSAGNVNGNGTVGDSFVEAFDENGVSHGVLQTSGTGEHNVTHLFGCAFRISKFRVVADVDTLRIASLTYREDGEALSPTCKSGVVDSPAGTVDPQQVFDPSNDQCFSPVSVTPPFVTHDSACFPSPVTKFVTLRVSDEFGNTGTCEAEVTVLQPHGVDFDNLGSFTTSQLSAGEVIVTADDGVSPADVNVLNLNGLGVVGGVFNTSLDSSEALRFEFDDTTIATAVAYMVLSAGNLNGNGTVGDSFVEAFGADGSSLGTVAVNSTGCFELAALFGASQVYSAFEVRADTDSLIIHSIDYVTHAVPLTPAQQKCLNKHNKNLLKLTQASGKLWSTCLKDFAKDKGVDDISACVQDDPKDARLKAEQKFVKELGTLCAGADGHGVDRSPKKLLSATPLLTLATVVAMQEDLLERLLGANGVGSLREADGKQGSRCQRAVAGRAEKCLGAKLKEFNKCKKAALKRGVATPPELSACIFEDPKRKIAKACDLNELQENGKTKLDVIRKELQKCIDKDVDLVVAFPVCGVAQEVEATHACLEPMIECAACNILDEADLLGADCDLLDNGALDGSCQNFDPS